MFLLTCSLLAPFPVSPSEHAYTALNPELGVVYRPPSVAWDRQQWDAVFRDPAPAAGWAVLPVGRESCSAATASWLSAAKRKGLQLAILLDSPLTPAQIESTIDCAIPLGFRRAIVDEYVTYNLSIGRPVCQVLGEFHALSQRIKARHPGFQFGVDENWHVWMEHLGRGQSEACGSYPYFRVDYPGLSVFTKYGTPSSGACGHPTPDEMSEQLGDMKGLMRDYSRSGKTFVWQLNQNYYPGGEATLQFFRQVKAVYGLDRFFLYGPTNGNDIQENWAYNATSAGERCPGVAYEWYLPARQYLIRMTEGKAATISLSRPQSASRGVPAVLSGRILSGTGLQVGGIQLQEIPPAGTLQSFTLQVRAPGSAFLAMAGVRVNSQLPDHIASGASFQLLSAGVYETGQTRNLVSNGEFDDGFRNWVNASTGSVGVVADASGKSLSVNCAANQSVSVSSIPFAVVPGRSYTLRFDARVFQEARNSAYFFVAWLNPGEVRRDRMFVKFPERRTFAAVTTRSDGTFSAQWTPQEHGTYSLFAFYPGSTAVQPCMKRVDVNVP